MHTPNAPDSTHTHGISRRGLLRAGAALAGLSALDAAAPAVHASGRIGPLRGKKALNAIFMVADGMSNGTLSMADRYSVLSRGTPSRWARLWTTTGVRRATQSTHSADSLVTDSAAASSAWSIGRKVNNGALSVLPDGSAPTPLLMRAKAAGKAVGVVTTTRVTHATPAGFCANVADRDREDEIARQMLERRLDVAFGGGAKHFRTDDARASETLRIVRDAAQLRTLAADPSRWPAIGRGMTLGVFADSHVPMVLDRAPNVPSLADMSRVALDMLARHPGGFVAQIEGGRVDHAGHANDAASLLREQLDFDEALGLVADFALGRDDTLVVITSDHGTGNPGLTFYGRRGNDSFLRLSRASHSFEWIFDRAAELPNADAAADAMPDLVKQALGITLARDDLDFLRRSVKGERVDPFSGGNAQVSVLGSVAANTFGVAFASHEHTNDYVETTALGPGSELLPAYLDNTDLTALLATALDLPPAP
ncbi:MAG: alkaline phosphatase [Phycisphaerae bacterium]|nr:alkaline phosphatase [Phycisphaerae bacterium]